MSLYIQIHEPRESRKALLVGKIKCLNALKTCEVFKETASTVRDRIADLNNVLNIVPEEIRLVLKAFPKIEVRVAGLEPGHLKCPYCGKAFKSEKGLNLHIKRSHPVESHKVAVTGASELERIESQIEALEKEISAL